MDHDAAAHYGQETGAELWYKTASNRRRYVFFDTLSEGIRWMQRNYKTIRPEMGSWQLLHICACFKAHGSSQLDSELKKVV